MIGKEFVVVFDEEVKKMKDVDFLVQGILYIDVIEFGIDIVQMIKLYYNVGGLLEKMGFKLIELFCFLFKDEIC